MAWKDNALGLVIDRSMDANFAALKEQGVSFVVIDCGTGFDTNPAFNEQFDKAFKAGLPVLVQYTPISALDDYTFEAPAREQIPVLKRILGTKTINALVISMERYWVGWDIETQHNPIRIATGAAINYTASELVHTMTKQYAPLSVQVMIRTNDNFVQKYAPDLSSWTDKFGFFLADWRYRTRAADGSYTHYTFFPGLTVSTIAGLRDALPPDGSKNPLVPGLAPSLKFWEFAGSITLPVSIVKGWDGKAMKVKAVLFNGNVEALNSYLDFDSSTPLPEEPRDPVDEEPKDEEPSDTGMERVIELLDEIGEDIEYIASVFRRLFK